MQALIQLQSIIDLNTVCDLSIIEKYIYFFSSTETLFTIAAVVLGTYLSEAQVSILYY